MRNEEFHDQQASASVSSFQSAVFNADAACSETQKKIDLLSNQTDRLKQQNAQLDEAIRIKTQSVALLETEEMRFECSHKSVEGELAQHQSQLHSLRRPRQEVEQYRENALADSREKIHLLVTSVTKLIGNVLQEHDKNYHHLQQHKNLLNSKNENVNNNSNNCSSNCDFSSSSSSSSSSTIITYVNDHDRELILLDSLLEDLIKERQILRSIVSDLNVAAEAKSEEVRQAQAAVEELQKANEAGRVNLQQLLDQVESCLNKHNPSNNSSSSNLPSSSASSSSFCFKSNEEEISFLQQKLSSILPQEQSKIKNQLCLKRDELRSQLQQVGLDLERIEEQVEVAQKDYETLLDEVSSLRCVKCGGSVVTSNNCSGDGGVT